MKKPARLSTFLILSTSIILSSCGGGNSKPQTTFGVNALMSEERTLTKDEINIATRICYAYQTKSQNFRTTNYYGTQFVFSTNNVDCQNISTPASVTTIMKYDDQNNLSYIPVTTIDPSFKFNRKVQTDSSGYLAQLCPKVLTNQQVNNTTTLQDVKVQISFFKEDLDGFMLQYFNKQTDNSYKIDSAEKFKIPTDSNPTNGSIRGMDQYYSTQKVCNKLDKISFSNFEQKFISR